MMLDPLAEVGIRVLVVVVIGGRQFVMDFQGRRKRGHRQKEAAQHPGQYQKTG